MRDIKFRFWDNANKCFVNDIYNHGFYKSLNDCLKYSNINQYIGIKDKNGKEIYEGDIVKYFDRIYVVVYSEDVACFELKSDNRIVNLREDNSFIDIEVIGNVYENKEMIK